MATVVNFPFYGVAIYPSSSAMPSGVVDGSIAMALDVYALYVYNGSAWVPVNVVDQSFGIGDGTAAAPSLFFTADTDTGIYRVGANDLGIATNGVLKFDVSASAVSAAVPVLHASGSAAAPAVAFTSDASNDSGLYLIGANNIGWSAGGTLRFDVSTSAVSSTLPVLGAAGTAAAPQYSFTADSNTGVYNVGADSLGLSTNGVVRITVNTASLTSTLPVLAPDGAVGAPSLSFAAGSTNGFFRVGSTTFDASANGASVMRFGTTLIAQGSASAPFSVRAAVDDSTGMKIYTSGTGGYVYNTPNDSLFLGANNATQLTIGATGSLIMGTAAIATNATDGFLYVATCAGAATGVPTTVTGRVPLVFDSSNGRLYAYYGAAWKYAAVAT